MCYTCPYSLCKGCTKDEEYLRVRGNKGFCTTCMKIIMLIENKDQASNDSAVCTIGSFNYELDCCFAMQLKVLLQCN